MTLVQTRALIALSLAMTVAVAVNLVVLQRRAPDRTAQRSAQVDLQALIAREDRGGGASRDGQDGTRRVPAEGGAVAGVQDGDLVRVIQRELAARQYAIGAADGVPGLMTRAAILAFEFDNGHPLTAEPSQALLKAILIGTPGPQVDAARAPADKARQLIATVQASLAALGYAGAGRDGRLGEATRRAIREFEMDRGLPRSGRVSPILIQELAKAARKGRMNKPAKSE
ncbi:MAG: peptidoglycan-binding domain-containing protein [Hyphomicrobiaceae bacterium]